jgi:oligoribonuclease NrnB/cAMP/cGMP phosphodiesterase (DHH superfamily)
MSKFLERRTKKRILQKDIVVIYHADCSDGFGGAWTAWKKFRDNADYVAVFHQQDVPEGLSNKEVYMIDFTYPESIMRGVMDTNKKVVAIDHHESNEEVTKMAEDYRYDVNHSGSVLAWMYFHPDKEVPLMLKYIEDTDLWNKKMPNTEAVFSYLDYFDFDFEIWSQLAEGFEKEDEFKEFIKKGNFIFQYQCKMVKRIISGNAELVEFEGHKTYVINSPLFRSELGCMLYRKLPPLAVVWYQKRDGIMFSLRSDGTVDVSEIAKKYDGGGHVSSAGFVLDADSPLPWKKLNE